MSTCTIINSADVTNYLTVLPNESIIINDNSVLGIYESTLNNEGYINNKGWINSGGPRNSGTLLNNGTITNTDWISNYWEITNNGTINNIGAIISVYDFLNNGIISNIGIINNFSGEFYNYNLIYNFGTIDNSHLVFNYGTIYNYCSGSYIGNLPGPNPIIYFDYCVYLPLVVK